MKPLSLVIGEKHTTLGQKTPTPEWIHIGEKGLYQGIIIFGMPGTGKTAGALYPWLLQLLGHPSRPGAIILDAKADFSAEVKRYLSGWGREGDLQEIVPGGAYRYDPMYSEVFPTEKIASNLITAMTVISGGGGGGDEGFFLQNAENAIRNAAAILKIEKGYCPMDEIFTMCDQHDKLDTHAAKIAQAVKEGRVAQAEVDGRMTWIQQWKKMPDRTRGSVIAEISRALSLFASEYLYKFTFCPSPAEATFHGFSDCLNKGKVVCLKMSKARYGNAALLVGTLMKLAFQETVMERISDDNKDRVTLMYEAMCDVRAAFDGKLDIQKAAQDADAELSKLNRTAPGQPEWFAARRQQIRWRIAMEVVEKPEMFPIVRRASRELLTYYRDTILPRSAREGGDWKKAELLAFGDGEKPGEILQLVELGLEIISARPGLVLPYNMSRPVIKCIDEYHVFATSSDTDYFDKSRQARSVNMVATQDISSMEAKMDKPAVDNIITILQNKLFLRNSNPNTNEYASKVFGERSFLFQERSISGKTIGRDVLQGDDLLAQEESINVTYRRSREAMFPPVAMMDLPTFTCLFTGSTGNEPIAPTLLYLMRIFELLKGDLSEGLPKVDSWWTFGAKVAPNWSGLKV